MYSLYYQMLAQFQTEHSEDDAGKNLFLCFSLNFLDQDKALSLSELQVLYPQSRDHSNFTH